jgi:hypothetical protein
MAAAHVHAAVIGTYGAPAEEWGADWNKTATFDNGYKRVLAETAKYDLTGKMAGIDATGSIIRTWDGADPSVAFLIQVHSHSHHMNEFGHMHASIQIYAKEN